MRTRLISIQTKKSPGATNAGACSGKTLPTSSVYQLGQHTTPRGEAFETASECTNRHMYLFVHRRTVFPEGLLRNTGYTCSSAFSDDLPFIVLFAGTGGLQNDPFGFSCSWRDRLWLKLPTAIPIHPAFLYAAHGLQLPSFAPSTKSAVPLGGAGLRLRDSLSQ